MVQQSPILPSNPDRDIRCYLEDRFDLCWDDDQDCENPEREDPITTFMLLAIDQAKGNWDERLSRL